MQTKFLTSSIAEKRWQNFDLVKCAESADRADSVVAIDCRSVAMRYAFTAEPGSMRSIRATIFSTLQ